MHDESHPNDELIAALAAKEPDVSYDRTLRDHVATCSRCAAMVAELATLRAALAELPDLRPSRPLQLIPAIPAAADRGRRRWLHRLFAPVLVAGSGLVLVGAMGLVNVGAASAPTGANFDPGDLSAGAPETAATSAADAPRSVSSPATSTDAGSELNAPSATSVASEPPAAPTTDDESATNSGPSPASLVLVVGLALVAGAFVLRFVIVPRAG